MDPLLRQRARAWIAGDPDPDTRAELQALLDAEEPALLADSMDGDLAFGTAGLRARVGAGSNRMNRAVVIRASRGLADHLRGVHGSGRVVVAHDARSDSERFAADAVGVFVAAGFDVSWFRVPTPTPLAAWWTRETGAIAGVVVTASHNPPADNGYKVFGRGGVQITTPTDAEVQSRIAAVGPAAGVPRERRPFAARVRDPGRAAGERYLAALAAARPDVGERAPLRIVVTPMHGVGGAWLEEALIGGGHGPPIRVMSQWSPDGTFPTVPFPNPEEPGALDEAMATATATGADLILALDPDADRLAVGIPTAEGWRRLTGDELGCLLVDHLLAGAEAAAEPVVASSIVSSRRIERVAALHGATSLVSLTGFKWIWRALASAADRGMIPILGYEEAIGYSVGDVVRDKDGIGAGVVVADLVAAAATRDRSPAELLTDLDRRVGAWDNHQHSVRLTGEEGRQRIAMAMQTGRRQPNSLGGVVVLRTEDLMEGAAERPAWLPADDVVIWHLAGGGRVLVRPSGTEPKLKIYIDTPVSAGVSVVGAVNDALTHLALTEA